VARSREREREREGLIKAEFFEQRRRITTRRMPGSFKRNGAGRKAQCFTVSASDVRGRRGSYTSSTRGSKSWAFALPRYFLSRIFQRRKLLVAAR